MNPSTGELMAVRDADIPGETAIFALLSYKGVKSGR
jgi:hypothetical protein